MDSAPLLQLLEDITGSAEVRTNPQLALFETQVLDSMRVVELIVELDEKFGIQISPAEFDRFVASEVARWERVVKAANIKPE